MQNNSNRLMAGFSLLAMFGVFAFAGTRVAGKAQGTQNVLVTNTSSQPIPIAARPGTGAYIVAVANTPSVKVASSAAAPVVTKDANNPDSHGAIYSNSFVMNSGTVYYGTVSINLSALPVVIDEISFAGASNVAGETINSGEVDVFDSSSTQQGGFVFAIPAVQNSGTTSGYLQGVHIPVPANGRVGFIANRFGGSTDNCLVSYSIAYHTVPNL